MATMFEGLPEPFIAPTGRRAERSRPPSTSRQATNVPAISGRSLDRLIQAEIIPRLLIAHPARAVLPEPVQLGDAVTISEAQQFATLALSLEADELLDRVDAILARGIPVESIFVDLLAPAARTLGEGWERDECDFVDVTMGLWRLQEVMREVAMRMPAVGHAIAAPRRALFSPMPGEQHSFGALMIEEVFARAGWSSEVLIEPRRQELLRIVAGQSFDLIGLTVSCDCPSAALADLITAMRSVSKNPTVQILIGGRVVNATPGLAERVGADGTAPDAQSALALADIKVPEPRRLGRVV